LWQEEVIKFKRLPYPLCYCEGCQLTELHREYVEAAEAKAAAKTKTEAEAEE
jgi:hypothetical protein